MAKNAPSIQSYGFSSSHVWVRELDYKESWVLKNRCYWPLDVEKTLEGPLNYKDTQPVNPKGNQPWIFIDRTDAEAENSNTLATWCEPLTHWKRPCCWERLKARGEGDERGWDAWIASPTWCTWDWVSSRSWWWTGNPGVLQSMASQRVRHKWVTALHWTEPDCSLSLLTLPFLLWFTSICFIPVFFSI